jgi:hypothetical protein
LTSIPQDQQGGPIPQDQRFTPSAHACRRTFVSGRAAGGPRRGLCRRRRWHKNSLNMRQRWRARREGTANDSHSSKVHRRKGYLATVQIQPVTIPLFSVHLPSFSSPNERLPSIGPPEAHAEVVKPIMLTLLHYTISELLLSCCDSAVAPLATAWLPRPSPSDVSGAAGNDLGTTINTCDAQRV